jgi:hypothetical protein
MGSGDCAEQTGIVPRKMAATSVGKCDRFEKEEDMSKRSLSLSDRQLEMQISPSVGRET